MVRAQNGAGKIKKMVKEAHRATASPQRKGGNSGMKIPLLWEFGLGGYRA
jgi:hypothetical protein